MFKSLLKNLLKIVVLGNIYALVRGTRNNLLDVLFITHIYI